MNFPAVMDLQWILSTHVAAEFPRSQWRWQKLLQKGIATCTLEIILD